MGRRRPIVAPVAAGALVRLLRDRFPEVSDELWTDGDTVEIQVPTERIRDVLTQLRDDPDFNFFFLADLAAVDYGPTNLF